MTVLQCFQLGEMFKDTKQGTVQAILQHIKEQLTLILNVGHIFLQKAAVLPYFIWFLCGLFEIERLDYCNVYKTIKVK